MRAILSNYFVTSFRSIKKNKALFAINLVGLVLAITCSLFAFVYINDELQFDQQHTDRDEIYRLYKRYINVTEGVDHLTFETSGMMGPTMEDEYPEVLSSVRVLPWWHGVVLTHKQTNISSEGLYFADANFFEFFDFEVVDGDPNAFLEAPSSIVLTESLARKIFKDERPIGKVVKGLNWVDYTVTGLVKDPPRTSSFQFDALVSWSTTVPNVGPLNMKWMNNWLAQGIYTFVKVSKDADPEKLTQKFPGMMERHFEERADQYFLRLLALRDMHLHGDEIRGAERMKSGSITFIYMLGFSAFLIFLIASVNYINVTLSRSTMAKKEVGIRKVMGSTKKQLMSRFIIETFLSTLMASVISLLIIALILPGANMISGKELPLEAFFQPLSIAIVFGFALLIGTLMGLYPAIVLSSPSVTSILRGGVKRQNGSAGILRKFLLAIQFGISIFLIICTMVVIRQMNYLENKPLGFDKEQVVVLDIGNEVGNHADLLETELSKHPNILSISTSRSTMGDGSYSTTVIPEGYSGELNTRIFGVDQEFFETFGVQTVTGRTFLKGSLADSNELIVNRTLVEVMGWDDPIGKHIRFSEGAPSARIIGVVEDFHIHSLATNSIEPMIIYLNTTTKWYTALRLGNGNLKETIAYINTVWDQFAKRTPFDFHFVDDWFNSQYEKERKLLTISTIYAGMSIVLCALGLFGLTSLFLQYRMKEISIRKVLGAPILTIVSMVNKQFLTIIAISFFIAIPISYYTIANWLDQFAYKMTLDAMPFLLSGALIAVVSLSIVSLLAFRSASVNPVRSLKSE